MPRPLQKLFLGKEKVSLLERSLERGSYRSYVCLGSRDRRNPQWPGGKNKYCRFTLYKENRDAVDVVNYLAKQLGYV